MAADRTSTLHNAQLYASKGQFDAAIGEWKKLAQDAPNDGTIYNSIGDLQLKRNAKSEAINAYLQAAKAFRDDGAPLKAIAAYKKILKIDPSRYDIYRFLGDLNAERGLLSSAVSDYLTLAKWYLKERKGKEALEVYRLIIHQDPSNLDAQERVAELCVQENMQDEAIKVYLHLGRERSAQGRTTEARDAYAAALRIDPNNREAEQFVNAEKQVTQEVLKRGPALADSECTRTVAGASAPGDLLGEARRRMDAGQYEGAEAMLSQMLSREPGNPEICRLLARLHLKQGQVNVALNEYRFLAGSALRSQEYDLAESLIQEFLTVEPRSVALLELLGELFEEKGDGPVAAQHYGTAIAVLLDQPDPSLPSLPGELYEKVRGLDPDGAVREKLAPIFEPNAAPVSQQAASASVGKQANPSDTSPSSTAHQAPTTEAVPIDHQVHYQLGIAFKNMGIPEEALAEFQVSVTNPQLYLDSCLMVSQCLRALTRHQEAIAQLEEALRHPDCAGDKARLMRYELGLLYKAESHVEKALKIFESIADFADARDHLEDLRQQQAAPSA
ncbi:MAG: tetratricopeptide repeat protein [Nitrospiraceae bacterium]